MGCLTRNLNRLATAISSSQTYFRLTSFHSRSNFKPREIATAYRGFFPLPPILRALFWGCRADGPRTLGTRNSLALTRAAFGLLYPSGRTLRVARVHRR